MATPGRFREAILAVPSRPTAICLCFLLQFVDALADGFQLAL
jgi:hypothetical protein